MSAWLLCVILDIHAPNTRVCQPEPDEATCSRDLLDWTLRSLDWEARSGIHVSAYGICSPGDLAP